MRKRSSARGATPCLALGIALLGLLSPVWADITLDNAINAYHQQKYPAALSLLQQTIHKPSLDVAIMSKALFYSGLTLAKMGQLDAARKNLETSGQIMSDSGQADSVFLNKIRTNIAVITRAQMLQNGVDAQKADRVLQSGSNRSVNSAATNYLANAIPSGSVIHWNASKMPLRVYISSGQNVPGWTPGMKTMVLQAMRAWQSASNGAIRLTETRQINTADLVIRWKQSLDHDKVGENPFEWVGHTIVRSDLVIATSLPNSAQPMSNEDLYKTMVHEMGHSLGIQGHSPYPDDIMYYRINDRQPMGPGPRDRETLRKLYALSPDIENDSTLTTQQSRGYYQALIAADRLYQAHQWEAAGGAYQKAQKLNPNDPILYAHWGVALQQTGNLDAAAQCYNQLLVITHDPMGQVATETRYNLAVIRVNQGVVSARAQQMADAQTAFRTAVDLFSQVVHAPKHPRGAEEHLAAAERNLQLVTGQ